MDPGFTGQPNLLGICSNLRYGEVLIQVGRAPGSAVAKYSGLKAVYIVKKIINGNEVFIDTYEHSFSTSSIQCCSSGDSGAFVCSEQGFLVGMLFGGSQDGDIGYFTTVSDLLQDIKLKTGVHDIRLMEEP